MTAVSVISTISRPDRSGRRATAAAIRDSHSASPTVSAEMLTERRASGAASSVSSVRVST